MKLKEYSSKARSYPSRPPSEPAALGVSQERRRRPAYLSTLRNDQRHVVVLFMRTELLNVGDNGRQ